MLNWDNYGECLNIEFNCDYNGLEMFDGDSTK